MKDDLLHLLTAAVDGELSPTEQWRVHQLLVESSEARSLLARLQSDSIRLKSRPLKQPPGNLTARILANLPKSAPAGEAIRRGRSRRSWASLAIAASLYLAVCAGAFWYITRPSGNARPENHAAAQDRDRDQPSLAEVLPRESASTAATSAIPANPTISTKARPSDNQNTARVKPPSPSPALPHYEPIPPPRLKIPPASDVFTAPLVPIAPIERMIVHVPVLLSLAELEQQDAKQRLVEEFTRDGAVRIDLFTKDVARGAGRFQAAAQHSGMSLFTDARAAGWLKRKQASSFAIYCESLSAQELSDLLSRLSREDADSKSPTFDSIHVSPALASDQKDLRVILGKDPGLWKRPAKHPGAKGKPKAGLEPKPISARTGDELTRSLTSPSTKGGKKDAILLTFTPAAIRTSPALSKELKEFLARRGERKASAVPALIVIRQAR